MNLKHQELYLQSQVNELKRKRWETEDVTALKNLNEEILTKEEELSNIRLALYSRS